jgi:hypothetical protein
MRRGEHLVQTAVADDIEHGAVPKCGRGRAHDRRQSARLELGLRVSTRASRLAGCVGRVGAEELIKLVSSAEIIARPIGPRTASGLAALGMTSER